MDAIAQAKADYISRMTGESLTSEQINHICQEYIEPKLIQWNEVARLSEQDSPYGNIAKAEIEKIKNIFIATKYWQPRKGQ
jgi:hypothetical protein